MVSPAATALHSVSLATTRSIRRVRDTCLLMLYTSLEWSA
jgi:hypothetical protein